VSGTGESGVLGYVVLRGRLGIRPGGVTAAELRVALVEAIIATLEDLGAEVDLMQLSPAIDPSWAGNGPANLANMAGRTGVR
jgi:hypothetical protein